MGNKNCPITKKKLVERLKAMTLSLEKGITEPYDFSQSSDVDEGTVTVTITLQTQVNVDYDDGN